MKLERAIQSAYQILKNNNIKSAMLDSELLMANVINKSREYIILNLNKSICKKDHDNFQNMVSQRKVGKPMAYLTNKKFFWKHEFFINKHVLIPRPDTEIIIDQVLKIYKNKKNINFLDNAYKLGLETKVKLFNSDIDKFTLGKYDLIISNPPYIKNSDLRYLEKDVKEFEPKLALDGGLDGTSEIRKVIKKSSELIKYGGKLILEIAYDQKKEVKHLLNRNGFYINSVIKDFAKNDRCIISTKLEN